MSGEKELNKQEKWKRRQSANFDAIRKNRFGCGPDRDDELGGVFLTDSEFRVLGE
jgi:hypothetical protein